MPQSFEFKAYTVWQPETKIHPFVYRYRQFIMTEIKDL